jgi:hypothetical protein
VNDTLIWIEYSDTDFDVISELRRIVEPDAHVNVSFSVLP